MVVVLVETSLATMLALVDLVVVDLETHNQENLQLRVLLPPLAEI